MVNIARNLSIDKTRSKDFRNHSKTEDIENIVLSVDKGNTTSMNPETLGLKDVVGLPQQTLDEEKAADEKLSKIAVNAVNVEAAEETATT